MKHLITATLISLLLAPIFSAHAEEVPASVKALAPSLAEWGKNPLLVAAVKEQNAQGMSLDMIKEKDKAWMATSGSVAGTKPQFFSQLRL